MINVDNDQFSELMEAAIAGLPENHRQAIKNVAFFVKDEPSPEQLERGGVGPGQILLGLYEGIPLPQRQGREATLPDKITLFKLPIESQVNSLPELREQIRHTVWHEVAHYFGLNHDDIRSLE